ncbi:MAG: alpha/beta hydrolase-fold protein [Bacteroidota bacterium]
MKKKLLIFLGIPLVLLAGFFVYKTINDRIEEQKYREWVASLEHTASPNVQILPDTILIDYLNEKRSLAIYLPTGYADDSVDYPVIYFLDGQSPFDQKIQEGQEWEIDEVIDSLALLGQEQAIVVGIYNSEARMTEYKPFPSTRWYSDRSGTTGDQHAEWIATDLKSWIDARYRTKKDPQSTIIAGASLGGLMSYYMLNKFPEVFGRAIVFSPSYWVNELVYSLHESNPKIKEQKIYFNAGELETPTVESIEKMHQILLDYGVPAANMKLDVETELGHWHMTWNAGFKKAYPWIVQ